MDTEAFADITSRILSRGSSTFVISAVIHAVLIIMAVSVMKEHPGSMDVFEVSLVERPAARSGEPGPPARLPDIPEPATAMSAPPPPIRSEQPARVDVPERKPAAEAVTGKNEKAGQTAVQAPEGTDGITGQTTRQGSQGGQGTGTQGVGSAGGGRGEGGETAGAGTGKFNLLAYQAAVRARVEAAKTYPLSARWRHMEGTVVISFRLNNKGKLLTVDIIKSSGSDILDEAAMKAVRRGVPYPEFLNEETESPPTMTINLKFTLE